MSRSLAAGVLLTGFEGTSVPPWLWAACAEGLAGVLLFAPNTPDLATTRALTDELRAHRPAGLPGLVVAVDEEGGDVTRLEAATGSGLPGNAALGAVDDPDLTLRCASALGHVLARAGVDLDLAPCLDVASEPLNPVIGTRSFGADPALVARHAREFARGLRPFVACCGKHYPGHGDTRVDSHLAVPVLDLDPDVLARRDLSPYGAAAWDAVMTGHIVVPALGRRPASLSRWATRQVRAAGHDGPIVTDALGMAAIADEHGLGAACVLALQAGADLLCLDSPQHRDPHEMYLEATAAIDAALADGRLHPTALAASAERTTRLVRRAVPSGEGAGAGAGTGGDGGVGGFGGVGIGAGDEVWDRRDAAIAGRDDAAALARLHEVGAEAARRALGVRGDVRLQAPPFTLDLRQRSSHASGQASGAFDVAFGAYWPGVQAISPLSAAEVTAVLDVAPISHEVVALTRLAAGGGLEGELLAAVLAARPGAVVVHTGVAAAAPELPSGGRLVCAHGSAAANARATADALAGQREAGHAPGATAPTIPSTSAASAVSASESASSAAASHSASASAAAPPSASASASSASESASASGLGVAPASAEPVVSPTLAPDLPAPPAPAGEPG